MKRRPKDYLLPAVDDGLPAPEVGPWAVEKYRRLGMYAEIFSTGMKNRWDCRTYIDLFAGPGHAFIRNAGHRVLTSPLLALTVPDPFDKYILCDREAEYLSALRARASTLASAAYPMWRDRWAVAEKGGSSAIRFLAQEYARAMTALGYLTTSLDQMIEVRTYENNMRLYYLAFFSKSDKGYEFWREVQKYSSDQLGLPGL